MRLQVAVHQVVPPQSGEPVRCAAEGGRRRGRGGEGEEGSAKGSAALRPAAAPGTMRQSRSRSRSHGAHGTQRHPHHTHP